LLNQGFTISIRPRILVAHDEPGIADTLAKVLSPDGFEACAAYSDENALQIATVFHPNLLISGVFMGKLNGIETAIRVRNMLPEHKILLVSGHACPADC
jgi:CheY-like chemotaxis protein